MITPPKKAVRVRLAPSPTGSFHVGTARTALFNWLFARQHDGVFVLRIEDTDIERSEKKFELEILESLHWLGFDWDEGPILAENQKSIGDYGPYRQSERKDIYIKYIEQLLVDGHAYYCYCTKEELDAERQAMLSQGLPPKYGGHCRNLKTPPVGKKPEVIRFRTPEATVEFKDIIRGKVAFNAALIGDIVIAKDISAPLFNLANVIDDELMKISHVIRGEDHLSNTPKQILFQKALGFNGIEYAHLPLILAPDRSKLSKRFSETSLLEYRAKGFLPEAIINFLALLGWHPKDDREVLSLKDLIGEFDLGRAQKGGAIFNREKLDWLQGEHLKRLSVEELTEKFERILKEKNMRVPLELIKKIVDIERARIKNLEEFAKEAEIFFALPEYDPALLMWKKQSSSPADIRRILALVIEALGPLKLIGNHIGRDEISGALSELIGVEGRGVVLWPLRVGLSGREVSPDPIEIIEILGIQEAERRIEIAIKKTEML
ncbi:MAG: glutamate--tRNA ligase [Patescibacteria group bacterium]